MDERGFTRQTGDSIESRAVGDSFDQGITKNDFQIISKFLEIHSIKELQKMIFKLFRNFWRFFIIIDTHTRSSSALLEFVDSLLIKVLMEFINNN